jgi:thioester reductase-like protein
MGIKSSYSELVATDIDEVWHTAGSISFSKKERDEIISINTFSAEKILEFIETVKPQRFHYISTAYVNDKSSAFENELDCDRDFNNPYEESKCKAEQTVGKWRNKNRQTKVFVYRPSIVVGDSRTGKISNFSGYYRYMRTYHIIKKAALKNGNSDDVEKNNEMLFLPISVPGVEDATINIITVDYAINIIMKLRDKDNAGTYHITHQNPPTYIYLLKESLKVLGISGPSVNGKKATTKSHKKIETNIRNGLQDYLPYISKTIAFSQANTVKVLGKDFCKHKDITPELVKTLLNYAITCDFKNSLKA